MIILGNLGAVGLYLHQKEDNCQIVTASVSLSLAIFIGLVCFHINSELKPYFSVSKWFKRLLFKVSKNNFSTTEANRSIIEQDMSVKEDCYFESYAEFRESLLDS